MWVGFLLGFEDALGECVGGVVFEDGDRLLPDDWAVVVLVVDEVDGAAGDADAGVEHGLVDVVAVHAGAAEGGDQRGVDVDDAAGEVGRHGGEFQEAGHGDVVDAGVAAGGEDGVAEGFVAGAAGGEIAAANDCVWGCRLSSAKLKSAGFGDAGDDEADVDRQLAFGCEVDEILERAAGAGDEDGEFEWRGSRRCGASHFTTRT